MSSILRPTSTARVPRPTLLRSLINRIKSWRLDRADLAFQQRAATMEPTIRDRQQELVRFYSHYEDLVETLIDLAKVGPTTSLETRYKAMRQWMQQNYPAVRHHAVVYLRYDAVDAQHSINICGKPADAFEALFVAQSLNEFLLFDDGLMIDRIARTREALNLYGHHLRRLASNT